MSQEFEISLSEMNDDTDSIKKQEVEIYLYDDVSNTRSITFVFLDDNRLSLYYHNLLSLEYNSVKDKNDCDILTVTYTHGKWIIRGKNMFELNNLMLNHTVRVIHLVNERYIGILDKSDIGIVSIQSE